MAGREPPPPSAMWDSGGAAGGDYGSGSDYAFDDDNETSSVQFSFTNVENNRSEENVIELPGTVTILQNLFFGLEGGWLCTSKALPLVDILLRWAMLLDWYASSA